MSEYQILPPAPTDYQSIPSFSSRLHINITSGFLMSTGLLQSSDAQQYTVRLLGIYSGALTVEVRIKRKCVIVQTIWVVLYC